ncbi:GNAT family N-acetyltransferase [Phycobacter azelaicus]|uniref:GNAT family N-acetyltransferase n=1 Tax=Phycobacter azelaicus TaxID=2668075 RepID=UPI001867F4DB|nr:N-acetyltransferase [Phycobacter azelaicus]MBE1296324.1 GNAT family N-acetyltransferase [Paracoccaceae bacterium]
MTPTLRPARSTDAGQMGEILHRFTRETTWMPDLYTGAEAIAFCGVMIDRGWVTVAETDQGIVGFLARDGAEICSLYLAAEACGQGIGKRLLDAAKGEVSRADQAPRLSLWTFQANKGAQRFYRREGFTEVRRSDGTRNEEGLPDIEYVWRPRREKLEMTA